MNKYLLMCVLLGLAGSAGLSGCAGMRCRDGGPVRTTQPHGWEQADLQKVASGQEVYAFDRFKLLYALGSVDPKTNLAREYVAMLSPEYIPEGAKPGSASPKPGRALLTNTEPVITVYQGYSYIWGRWPLVTTTRASGIVEQFQGGRSRTIIWIDQSTDDMGNTSEVHRIFFLPDSAQERLRLTLTEACNAASAEVVIEKRAYVEILRDGACNRFAGPPVLADSEGWWNNPYIDNFVKTVLAQRDNAGLK